MSPDEASFYLSSELILCATKHTETNKKTCDGDDVTNCCDAVVARRSRNIERLMLCVNRFLANTWLYICVVRSFITKERRCSYIATFITALSHHALHKVGSYVDRFKKYVDLELQTHGDR